MTAQKTLGRPLDLPTCLLVLLAWVPTATAATLLQEDFEDADYASRGWYDTTGGALSTSEHVAGSTASFECTFLAGEQGCSGGSPGRFLFLPESESVYVGFQYKHSASWEGSGVSYHPHASAAVRE